MQPIPTPLVSDKSHDTGLVFKNNQGSESGEKLANNMPTVTQQRPRRENKKKKLRYRRAALDTQLSCALTKIVTNLVEVLHPATKQ